MQQVIATTKIYNIASINRSCFADEGFSSQLSFKTFFRNQLCNAIIKMSFFARTITIGKSISRFFLCLSIFLCLEICILPNALAMNTEIVLEAIVKKTPPLIKQLKDFVQDMMLAGTSSNNISINPHYSGPTQSRDNYTDNNNTGSKALRVKNIQSHGNANPLFFSTLSPLLKHYNYYKSISGKAPISLRSIHGESQYNQITTKLVNFSGLSHQSTDLDDVDDEDSGIEDIFEKKSPLDAIPIPALSRESS